MQILGGLWRLNLQGASPSPPWFPPDQRSSAKERPPIANQSVPRNLPFVLLAALTTAGSTLSYWAMQPGKQGCTHQLDPAAPGPGHRGCHSEAVL